jgi:hypothetical protein
MKNKTMVACLCIAIGIALLSGCSGPRLSEEERDAWKSEQNGTLTAPSTPKSKEAKPKTVKAGISLPNLALKSRGEVDKFLGSPSSITEITSNPANMPGEYREYKTFSSELPTQIRFHRNKAVKFVISLDKSVFNERELLDLFGLQDLPGKPDIEAPAAYRWKNVRVGKARFSDISVENSTLDSSLGWDILTAEATE